MAHTYRYDEFGEDRRRVAKGDREFRRDRRARRAVTAQEMEAEGGR